MQLVSKQQFECLRHALWTVQLGTVNDYNTSFWKDVAKNGFDNYLTGIDEYENHSARSVRFVHDMDPVGASSDTDGDGLEPPTPHSLSDRVGWENLIPRIRRRMPLTLNSGLVLSLVAVRLNLCARSNLCFWRSMFLLDNAGTMSSRFCLERTPAKDVV
eukprot:1757466-Amphidinium_carterae.1